MGKGGPHDGKDSDQQIIHHQIVHVGRLGIPDITVEEGSEHQTQEEGEEDPPRKSDPPPAQLRSLAQSKALGTYPSLSLSSSLRDRPFKAVMGPGRERVVERKILTVIQRVTFSFGVRKAMATAAARCVPVASGDRRASPTRPNRSHRRRARCFRLDGASPDLIGAGRLPSRPPLIPAVKQQDDEKNGDPIAQESEDRHRYRIQAHQDADGNDKDLHPRDGGQQKHGNVCPLQRIR